MMSDFNSLFPSFLTNCVQLKTALTPVAYLLLTAGLITAAIGEHQSVTAIMRTLGRTIVYIILLTFIVSWGNQLCQFVADAVKNQLGVDPGNVFQQYAAMLIPQKSQSGQHGLLEWIFSSGGSFVESVVTGILWMVGIVAEFIVFLANIVQHFILYLGYTLSPIFIGFLAFERLRGVGYSYLLNMLGVILWPLGWAVAAIVTSGLLSFMTSHQLQGGVIYGLQNLLGVCLLGIWMIFSTMAVPVIIQKALASGALMGGELLSGARSATKNAAASGISTGGAILSAGLPVAASGAGAAVLAGAAAVGGAAAAAGSFVKSASGDFSSSMTSALAQVAVNSLGRQQRHAKPAQFAEGDRTGEKSVNAALAKNRNSYDGGSGKN